MSGRRARRGRQVLASTDMIPPAATEPPPPPAVLPETIPTVISAVENLDAMGAQAFEVLLAGYRDVEAAKGATFAYAWLMYQIEYRTGPTATRAMCAAGVLAAHRARRADAEVAGAKAVRVEWLRWAVEQMAVRHVAATCDASPLRPMSVTRARWRWGALQRLLDALAREAS